MSNEIDLTVENMKFLSREAALKENTRVSELKNNVITAAFNSVKSRLSNEFGTSITLDSPKSNLIEFTPNMMSGKITATLSVDTIDGVKRVPINFKVRASVPTLVESVDEIKDKLDNTEGSLESEIREIMSSQEAKLQAKAEEEKIAKQIDIDILNGISLEASKKERMFKEAKREEIDMHTIQDNSLGSALPPQILTYPKAYLPEMKKDKSIINIGGFKYKYIGDEPTITGDTENGVIARFALMPIGKKASLNTENELIEKQAADYSSMTSSELKEFVKPYANSKNPLPKDLADAITFFPSVVSDYASQFTGVEELETKLTDAMKDAIARNPKEAFNIFNKLSKGKDFDSFPEFIKTPILDDMDVLQDFATKNPESLTESMINAISENPNVMLDLVDDGNIKLPADVKTKFSDKLIELGYAEKKEELTPEQEAEEAIKKQVDQEIEQDKEQEDRENSTPYNEDSEDTETSEYEAEEVDTPVSEGTETDEEEDK